MDGGEKVDEEDIGIGGENKEESRSNTEESRSMIL
jgi:hypothetical protein